MTKIEWIEIENFRGISHLRYEPKKINLLIGRNNSGKSTVLDAIYRILTGHTDTYNGGIRGPTRKYDVNVHAKYALLTSNEHKYIIYKDIHDVPENYQEKAKEMLKSRLQNILTNDKKYNSLLSNNYLFEKILDYIIKELGFSVAIHDEKIHILINYLLNSESTNKFMVDLSNILKDENINYPKKDLFTLSFLIHELSYDTIDFVNEDKKEEEEEKSGRVSFINNFDKFVVNPANDPLELLELDKLVRENNLIPNLERLMEGGVVYKDGDNTYFLPYETHGTGFAILLSMISSIRDAKGGVLLVEEPENHMHPGYLKVFIEQLMHLSQILDVQVFMTTHSYDMIDELSSYPNTSEEKAMIQVASLIHRDNELEIYYYSPDEVQRNLNKLMIDLRGI